MSNAQLQQILEVNQKQKEFYNHRGHSYKGVVSKTWAWLRQHTLSGFTQAAGIKDRVYNQHMEWMGDLSNKRVLDLGCLEGNRLSFYLAEHAAYYLGIDLSDKAIEKFREKLDKKGLQKAHVMAVDFLSPQFAEGEFDLIYAYGVLHHFPDLKILTDKLNEKLAPGGQIIAYDPLQTSTPIRIMRALYRPFQTDKDWEWPFTAKTLEWFASQFTVKAAHGMLGKSKYGLLVNLLPAGRGFKNRWISKAVKADWDATMDSRKMLSCMHLTMLLQKK